MRSSDGISRNPHFTCLINRRMEVGFTLINHSINAWSCTFQTATFQVVRHLSGHSRNSVFQISRCPLTLSALPSHCPSTRPMSFWALDAVMVIQHLSKNAAPFRSLLPDSLPLIEPFSVIVPFDIFPVPRHSFICFMSST